MFEGCDGRVCDAWPLQASNCLLPSFVCYLGLLLNVQLCSGLLVTVECAETVWRWRSRETRLQDLLREKARPELCLGSYLQDARFGCDESSQVCKSSDVSLSLEPNSGPASTECRLYRAVLRETREEPFERPLHNLVVDFCSPLFLKVWSCARGMWLTRLPPRLPRKTANSVLSADLGKAGRARALHG